MKIKSLIRNISKEKNVNPQIVLRNYMLERLLERISKSEYKYNFVLKGGMLVASIVGLDEKKVIWVKYFKNSTLQKWNFPL